MKTIDLCCNPYGSLARAALAFGAAAEACSRRAAGRGNVAAGCDCTGDCTRAACSCPCAFHGRSTRIGRHSARSGASDP